MAREGSGETRSRTGRAAEDRGGGGAIGPTRAAGVRLGADRSPERRRIGSPPPSRHPQSGSTRSDLADPAPVELGSGYADVLAAGLEALGLDLDPETRMAIDRHAGLVLAWTSRVNLTATRDPVAFARDHVLDSLTAVPLLRAHGIDAVLDLGSGAGLPGIPLALALPAARWLLVEARTKKAAVLERIVAALGQGDRIRVVAARAEDLAGNPAERASWPAVTARAVGPLADLVELGLPLLQFGGLLVAWKAERLIAELPAAERAAAALGGSRPVIVEPDGPALRNLLGERRLVVIEKIRETPEGVPRPPAVRRRRPW